LALLLDPESPGHLANHDNECGSYFYVPDENSADDEEFEDRMKECAALGLSERFRLSCAQPAGRALPTSISTATAVKSRAWSRWTMSEKRAIARLATMKHNMSLHDHDHSRKQHEAVSNQPQPVPA